MTRILVIGHGLIGKQRARAIAALEQDAETLAQGGVRLAGTVDPLPRPDLYAGAPHFASLDQVNVSSFDAAVIAIPHHLIAEVAGRILGQGKPALIEKPLGLNLGEARVIARLAAPLARPSFVGYSFRFLPTVRVAFERVAAGYLGNLRSVDMVFAHGGHPRSGEEWKLQLAASGGGVLIDPGVHLLDLALCFVPGLTCRSAVATTGFWKTGIEEDLSTILTRDRTLVSLRVSLVRWANTFRVDLIGDDGYAIIDGRGGTYGNQTVRLGKRWAWADGSGRSQRQSEEQLDLGLDSRYIAEETEAVVRTWLTGKARTEFPHPATLPEAMQVAELCDAMYALIR
jgi:predicted dehydrogenase